VQKLTPGKTQRQANAGLHMRAADAADRRFFRAWNFWQSSSSGVGVGTLVSAVFL